MRQDRLNLLKIEIKKRKKGNDDKIQTGHNTNRQKVNVTKYKTDNKKMQLWYGYRQREELQK